MMKKAIVFLATIMMLTSCSSSKAQSEMMYEICIDGTGKILGKFQDVFPKSDGLYCVKQNGKYGYIDEFGKVLIDYQYDYAISFKEGVAVAGLNGKFGFIDKTSKYVLNPIYDGASSFYHGVACIYTGGKYGFIDRKGTIIVPPVYEAASFVSDGMIKIKKERKYGFFNLITRATIKPQFDYADDFHNGLAYVGLNGKYGLLSKNGNIKVLLKYDFAPIQVDYYDSDTLFDRFVFYDKSKAVYSFQLLKQSVARTRTGLVAQKMNGKYGFVDYSGNIKIPFKYDKVTSVMFGYIAAVSETNSVLMNTNGDIVFKFENPEVIENIFSDDLILVRNKLSNKVYIYSITKNKSISKLFDAISHFALNKVVVRDNEKYGIMDLTKLSDIKIEYDYTNVFNNGDFVLGRKEY